MILSLSPAVASHGVWSAGIWGDGIWGAGLALLSAVAWGGGDFAGGMGVKAAGGSTTGALRVVIAAHGMSLVVLASILLFAHAARPHGAPLVWGLLAGVAAGLSLTAFYIALARGEMGASAAVSGLLAAAIPAVVSLFLDGFPTQLRVLGFVLAAAAIWMIAAGPSPLGSSPTSSAAQRQIFLLAVGGGIGFGVYFVALRLANPLGVLRTMEMARIGSLFTCFVLLLLFREKADRIAAASRGLWLTARGWAWALGVAVLDTGGNLLFVAATRKGRLDASAVLASLYPASTILLAALLLKERPSRRQLLGMGVAATAAVLIAV